MAQLAEQLICNQQVFGSSPNIGSFFSEGFPSGQRGQTVNLLRNASVVRIHHLPILFKSVEFGVLAQLGEHLPYKQRVTGSSPVGPIFYNTTRGGAVWKLVGLITRRS